MAKIKKMHDMVDEIIFVHGNTEWDISENDTAQNKSIAEEVAAEMNGRGFTAPNGDRIRWEHVIEWKNSPMPKRTMKIDGDIHQVWQQYAQKYGLTLSAALKKHLIRSIEAENAVEKWDHAIVGECSISEIQRHVIQKKIILAATFAGLPAEALFVRDTDGNEISIND